MRDALSLTDQAIAYSAGNLTNEAVQAAANFNIDRRDWNLTYGADKSLGDKMLYSDVNIGFNIRAER